MISFTIDRFVKRWDAYNIIDSEFSFAHSDFITNVTVPLSLSFVSSWHDKGEGEAERERGEASSSGAITDIELEAVGGVPVCHAIHSTQLPTSPVTHSSQHNDIKILD